MSRRLLILTGLFAALLTAPASAHDGGAVVEWNRIALRTTAQAPFNPPRETRSLAIVQAAVLDSVTSITHGRPPYLVHVAAPRDASVDAAVAAAAHATLVALYPEQRPALDAAYSPGGPGADVGEAVAAAVLALRAHDGADAVATPPVVSGPRRLGPDAARVPARARAGLGQGRAVRAAVRRRAASAAPARRRAAAATPATCAR
jgi:hypothetical protein